LVASAIPFVMLFSSYIAESFMLVSCY